MRERLLVEAQQAVDFAGSQFGERFVIRDEDRVVFPWLQQTLQSDDFGRPCKLSESVDGFHLGQN